eukprot:3749221-Rhodomonas_salina.1
MDQDGGCDGNAVSGLDPWLSVHGFTVGVLEAADSIDEQLIRRFAAGCNGTIQGCAWFEDWQLGEEQPWRDFWVTKVNPNQLPPATKSLILKCHGRSIGELGIITEGGNCAAWSPVPCNTFLCSCEEDASCFPQENCRQERLRHAVPEMMGRTAMIPLVENMRRFFRGEHHAMSCPATQEECRLDIPVSVMNLPAQTSRRVYMESMLALLGFTRVSFPVYSAILGRDL